MKYTKQLSLHDLRKAESSLRKSNDAISVLVSALSYQVTARTFSQQTCDYCGEQYHDPGPMAWASHHCRVLTAAENIISECVQHLLRERAIAKGDVERNLAIGEVLVHHSA